MKSHLLLLLIASALISVVLALLSKDTWKERKKFIVTMFLSLFLFVVITAWIIFFLH
jgi:hypothetical protein